MGKVLWDTLYNVRDHNKWMRLNGGTIPPFKIYLGGTVRPFEMHTGGTVPPFKMHNGGTLHFCMSGWLQSVVFGRLTDNKLVTTVPDIIFFSFVSSVVYFSLGQIAWIKKLISKS